MVDTALYHLMQQESTEEPSTETDISADAEKLADDKNDLAPQSETKSAASKRGTALYKLTSILGKSLPLPNRSGNAHRYTFRDVGCCESTRDFDSASDDYEAIGMATTSSGRTSVRSTDSSYKILAVSHLSLAISVTEN